ncbi:MAG: hypothetical protein SGCHY_005198, partial [Lobulomycetales sp.]
GAKATREFIHTHFLSRTIKVGDHIHYLIQRPRALLVRIFENLDRPRPIARILKESGRASRHPVFLVGIFSGGEKLGEGYGESLAMAEIRATRAVIEEHYLADVQNVKDLPSDDLGEPSFLERD